LSAAKAKMDRSERAAIASIAPRLTCRDDRPKRPLLEAGCAREDHIFPKNERRIFLRGGLDSGAQKLR
jgi:hypothetical protein